MGSTSPLTHSFPVQWLYPDLQYGGMWHVLPCWTADSRQGRVQALLVAATSLALGGSVGAR